MIKRVLCFLICFCLFFTFIACDGDKKQDTPATSSATTEAQTTEEPDDDGSSSGSKKPSKPQPSLSKATIKIGLSLVAVVVLLQLITRRQAAKKIEA